MKKALLIALLTLASSLVLPLTVSAFELGRQTTTLEFCDAKRVDQFEIDAWSGLFSRHSLIACVGGGYDYLLKSKYNKDQRYAISGFGNCMQLSSYIQDMTDRGLCVTVTLDETTREVLSAQ
jgi:cellobiose-specific phosphotransferase system component IIC